MSGGRARATPARTPGAGIGPERRLLGDHPGRRRIRRNGGRGVAVVISFARDVVAADNGGWGIYCAPAPAVAMTAGGALPSLSGNGAGGELPDRELTAGGQAASLTCLSRAYAAVGVVLDVTPPARREPGSRRRLAPAL